MFSDKLSSNMHTCVLTCAFTYLHSQAILVYVGRHRGDRLQSKVKHWNGIAQFLYPIPHEYNTE